MKDQLISFETAKLAKEKGFNQFYCCTHYNKTNELITDTEGYPNGPHWVKYMQNCISAPTQSLLQKWLRDIYRINVVIDFTDNTLAYGYDYTIVNSNIRENHDEDMIDQAISIHNSIIYNTYEEALEAGLKHALTLI